MKKFLLSFSLFIVVLTAASQESAPVTRKNGACYPTGNGSSSDKQLPAILDGNGTLGNTYSDSKCGLNYVQTSVRITSRMTGLPGVGIPATMTISGIPTGPCVA